LRSKQHEVRKLARRQPRKSAAVIDLAEGQPSVPLDAVPAQQRFVKPFTAHGLHGIAKDRFDVSDFYRHVVMEGRNSSALRSQ
jgi:hypothetical protein